VAQYFGHLAVWNATPGPFDPECTEQGRMSEACISYYEDKIMHLMEKKVVEFPHFTGLSQFSAHPDIEQLLQDAVIRIPSSYVLTGTAIEHDQHSLENLAARAKLGHLTHVNIRWPWSSGHALIAYGVMKKTMKDYVLEVTKEPKDTEEIKDKEEPAKGQEKVEPREVSKWVLKDVEKEVVCVIDSNYPPEKGLPLSCENYFYDGPKGGIIYQYRTGRLYPNYFSVMKENDANLVDFNAAWGDYYAEKKKTDLIPQLTLPITAPKNAKGQERESVKKMGSLFNPQYCPDRVCD